MQVLDYTYTRTEGWGQKLNVMRLSQAPLSVQAILVTALRALSRRL